MGERIIRFADVKKSFGPNVIYTGLDLEVFRGETLTVIGGSGVGKSVMLKILIGLLTPDSGEVEAFGESVVSMNRKGLQPAAQGVIPPTQPSQVTTAVSLPAIDTSALTDAAKMNKEAFDTALESAKMNKEAAESMQNISAETLNKFQVDIGGLDVSGIAEELKASLADQIKNLIQETLSKSLDYLNPFTNKPPGT